MGDAEQVRREHFAAGAIYGTVVYLTILVLLEEDRTDPGDAIAILVGTALTRTAMLDPSPSRIVRPKTTDSGMPSQDRSEDDRGRR